MEIYFPFFSFFFFLSRSIKLSRRGCINLYRPSLKTSNVRGCLNATRCGGAVSPAVWAGWRASDPQTTSSISSCAVAVLNLFCLNKSRRRLSHLRAAVCLPTLYKRETGCHLVVPLCSSTAELRRCAGALLKPPLEWNSNSEECLLFTAARTFLFSHLCI